VASKNALAMAPTVAPITSSPAPSSAHRVAAPRSASRQDGRQNAAPGRTRLALSGSHLIHCMLAFAGEAASTITAL
jgi:hypothetical protein